MATKGIYYWDGTKYTLLGTNETITPVDPPVDGRWDENVLYGSTWDRPTGSEYVTWESIVGTTEANRQAASPNTPTALNKNIISQVTVDGNGKRRILSLPKGVFHLPAGFNSADSGYGQVIQQLRFYNGAPGSTSGASVATGGTFTLSDRAKTFSANFAYNASSADIQTALRAWGGVWATTTVSEVWNSANTVFLGHNITTAPGRQAVIVESNLTGAQGTTPNIYNTQTNAAVIAIGNGASVGYSTGCRGIVGAGPRWNSTGTTTITMAGPETNEGNFTWFLLNGVDSPVVGGIHLVSQQSRGDNVYHAGIVISGATGRNGYIKFVSTKGMSPGYSNAPPGETFGINILNSPDILVEDCEFDGRDKNNVRTCASPIGWNSAGYSNGNYNSNTANTLGFTLVRRCYSKYGLTSMLTFWETFNIRTEDYKVYSWGTGSGSLRSSGINHEQYGGKVEHIRPTILLCQAPSDAPAADKTSNNGGIFGFGTVLDSTGNNGTLIKPSDIYLTEVIYDAIVNAATSKALCYNWNYGYKVSTSGYADREGWDWMTKLPIVTDSRGVELISSLQKTYKGQASISGWNTKDKLVYVAVATG